jgi:hypothetical protein
VAMSDGDMLSGVDRLAAECPRGLSAAEHAQRTTIHVIGQDREVQCLDRTEKRRSLERTDAQVADDDEIRTELETFRATPEGEGFFGGLAALGYTFGEAVTVFARHIASQGRSKP